MPQAELALSTITPNAAIRPGEGDPDANVSVVVTGRGFRKAGARLLASGPGVAVSAFEIESENRITATLTISSAATYGAHDVGVATDDLTSNSLPFRVVSSSAPTLTSIAPQSGMRGTAVPVTITGTNFAAGSTTVEVGGDLTASNVQVVSPTQITATFTIPPGAGRGDYAVRVTKNGEFTSTVIFQVTQGVPPTATAISPGSGARGAVVPVVVTGTGFVDGAELIISDGRIIPSAARVVNPTQIIATLTVDPNAELGAHEVKVLQYEALSNGVPFTVTPAAVGGGAPVITRVTPDSGTQGSAVSLTITGENFAAGARLNLTGINPGIDPAAVQVVSPTQIVANFTLPLDAVPGAQEIVVVQDQITSNAVPFTIARATFDTTPTLTRVSPNELGPGSHAVTLTGTNFTALSAVQVSGGGTVTVSDVTYASSTEVRATFTVSGAFTSGRRDVTVTTGAGTSNPAPIFLFR